MYREPKNSARTAPIILPRAIINLSCSLKLQVSSPMSEIFTLGEWKVDVLSPWRMRAGRNSSGNGKGASNHECFNLRRIVFPFPIPYLVDVQKNSCLVLQSETRYLNKYQSCGASVAAYSSSLKSSSSESSESLHLRTIETITTRDCYLHPNNQ